MILCICRSLYSLFSILSIVKGQGDVFNPGKYKFTGSINVLPNGNVNLRLNAKKVGVGPSLQPPGLQPPGLQPPGLQPPSLTPTQSTHGSTTGTPSGGAFSTSTGPTTGYSTPTGESGRMAGTGARHQRSENDRAYILAFLQYLFYVRVMWCSPA